MMGIVFVDFICYFFNNLEIMADKKRNICQRVEDSFLLKSKASVHVRICISKLTHFRPG